MATKWPAIVIRCNVGETGDVPRAATSTSPDIIISGKEPFADPGILTNPANYNNAYDNSLYVGYPNYLYVRGKNFTAAPLSGSWNLFWAQPNILLYPALWEQNQLKTSSGNPNPPFAIAPGAIGASTDCFNWTPPGTTDSYCFIAIADTPGYGNPLAGVDRITDLAEVLANNGNIALRNVNVVRGDLPEFVVQVGYNQGSEPAKIDLAVVFQNVPKHSRYSVSSGTPLNGRVLFHEDGDTQYNDFKFVWTDLDIPANWNTMFDITIKFGSDWSGIPPDKFPSVAIRGELIQSSQDRLYYLGEDAGSHPDTHQPRVDASGIRVRVIIVGSVTTLFPDVKRKG